MRRPEHPPVLQCPTVRLVGLRRSRRGERGYIMLVALIMMAILTVLGASTLQVAGIDQRIALQNRKHMLTVNTAHAGTEHARDEMRWTEPVDEGIDTSPDTHGDYVGATDAETSFGGVAYTHNLGVYWVTATYHRCGNPPPATRRSWGRTSSGPTTGRWRPRPAWPRPPPPLRPRPSMRPRRQQACCSAT